MYTANKKIETFHLAYRRGYEPSRTLLIICLLISGLFHFAAAGNTANAATAATYYLDAVNGDDSWDGLAPEWNGTTGPWRTINKAFNTATYGDTVILRDGNYGDVDNPVSFPIYTGSMTEPLPANTQFITFKAEEEHTPIFTRIKLGNTNNYYYTPYIFEGITVQRHIKGAVYLSNCVGVRLKNLTIFGTGVADGCGIMLYPRANDIKIEDSDIHTYKSGIYCCASNVIMARNNWYDIGDDHILVDRRQPYQEKNILIEDNHIYYNHRLYKGEHPDAISMGGDVSNIIIRRNELGPILGSQGIYFYGQTATSTGFIGNNVLIENNLLYDIWSTEAHIGARSNNLTFRNNTVIGHYWDLPDCDPAVGQECGPNIGQLLFHDDISNAQSYNNIFVSTYGGSGFPAGSVIYHDYNIHIYKGREAPWQDEPHSYGFPDWQTALTELFVDGYNYDFRLKEGCRAVNRGDPNNYPETDILGNPRIGRPDAGCYEYISGPPDTTPPSTPQNLSATAISEHQIDLSWDESSDPESGISHYNIYRDANFIATSVSNSYSDTGLNGGTPYSYKVSAVNGAGLESDRSNTAEATTFSDTTPPSIVSVSSSETSVEITFSELLDSTSAEQTNNYSVNNGISVAAASLDTDTVTLTTSAHAEGTYTLTVVNVRDTSGNPMTETTTDYEYDYGLVGHWRFDDGSGNSAVDSSGNSNTGTLINGPTWTTGKIDGALSFDGVDDAVQIGTGNLNLSSGTIALWSYAENFSSTGQYLFTHATQPWANRIQLYTDDASGNLDLGLGDSHTRHTNIQDLNTNIWYHIALTWEGTNYVVYVDSVEKASGTFTGLSILETYADIGNNGYSSDRTEAFGGIIDEVRIYNRALNTAEILELYDEGTTPDTTPPVISNVQSSNVTTSQATITWTTNEPATSQVEYGLDTNYGNSISDPALVTSHTLTPTGLEAGTLYHYRVISADASGNQSISQDNDFTTAAVSIYYSITASASGGGTISPSGTTQVVSGGSQTFTITANTGYHISDVVVDGSSVGVVTSYPFTNVTADHTIAATFAIDTYTITAIAGSGGQISPSGTTQVNEGENQTFTITANAGYHISDVVVDGSSVGAVNSYTFTNVIADHTIAATFAVNINTYTITASASGSGTISPSGTTQVNEGENQTFTITANAGYHISDVVVDGSSVGAVNSYTFTNVTADHTIAASFAIDEQDVTAPAVANLSPQADSIQAPLNTLVILDITDSGDGVDANSVEIEVNGETVYSGNTTTYGDCHRIGTKAHYAFIYQSNEMFDFDQPINVTANATDLAGNVMEEYSYSFKTEMRSFGENKKVDLSNLKKGRPVTVRDSKGDIWAAWHAGVTGSRDIYIGKLKAEAEYFGSSVQLTSDAAECNPVIAAGSDDTLYVAWQDNRRGNWDIYVSTSNDWSAEIRVTDSNDNQINPAIVVDSSLPNNAYIVWEDDRNGNQDIYVAKSSDGFVTKTVSQITSDSSDQVEPAIAVDSDNTIYVVWTDTNSGKNDIYGAASNGSWANIPVVTEEESQSSPAIATEAVGSILHLVWVDDRTTAGDDDIFYAKTTGGLTPLTGSSIIDDDTGADQISPVIITTGTGDDVKVFTCWRDERNADADLYLAEISSEGDYGANVFVGDEGTNSDQSEPAIGIDGHGHPYLVWTNERTDICYAGSTYIESELASTNVSITSEATVGTMWNAIQSVDDVSAEVPQGAYLCDVEVTISRIKNPQKFNFERSTGVYEFGPSGMEFTKPVTITIPYEVNGSENVSYKAYWYNSLTNTLSQQGITDVQAIVISSNLHALRFKTTHFSPFILGGALGGLLGGGGGGGCSMSPNSQDSIVELLLPYIGLAVAMLILKLRDRRKRKAHNIAKS